MLSRPAAWNHLNVCTRFERMLLLCRDGGVEPSTKLESFQGRASHISGGHISKLIVYLSSIRYREKRHKTLDTVFAPSGFTASPLLRISCWNNFCRPVPTVISISCSLQRWGQCLKHLTPLALGQHLARVKYSKQFARTKILGAISSSSHNYIWLWESESQSLTVWEVKHLNNKVHICKYKLCLALTILKTNT